MFLDRGDVNPEQPDTKYGRTPLSWAAQRGHEGVVKMLLQRKDVSTATLDRENQTPQSRALSNGHHRVVTILLEHDRINSPPADRAGRESPPTPSPHWESSMSLKFRDGDLDTHIIDVSGQHAPLSPEPDNREPVSDLKRSLSESANSNLPSTKKARLSEPPHM
ncbi:hypothetical protein HOY82DRAFT_565395 [Tuber indicum]|nr:hypothetical protein HOY82DRAFT_565395 [Tuber indicum]